MASEEAFAQKPPRFTIQRHTHKPQGGGRQIASPTEKGGSAEELLPQKRYRAGQGESDDRPASSELSAATGRNSSFLTPNSPYHTLQNHPGAFAPRIERKKNI